ncbi:glutamate receptor ionotropic, NMDA 1 [Sarotherodon galilaeus]
MPLLRASSPADPSRHPRPLVPTKAREPRPIQIGAYGSSTAKPHRTWGSPPHPTAEETIPTPTFNHLQTTQDNRHPEWTSARMEQPPCQLKSPPVRSMHQRPPAPGLSPRAPTRPQPRRHTDEDRSPQGPARAPSRRRSTPEPQAPPPAPDPLRGSQATRPVTYVRQYRPSPSPAARSHEENTL